MRRLLVILAAAGLLASACGAQGAQSVDTLEPGDGTGEPTGEPATGTPGPTDGPTEDPGGETMTYEVWYHLGETLFVTRRTEPFDPGIGSAAVRALLEGPSARETAAGVGTSIPAETSFNGLSIEGGVATVDLSSAYESGGGTLSMTMRLAQVVYTLTQFDSVGEGVLFELDGEPVTVFSGEGIVLDRPVARDDYLDLYPIILVEDPLIGARVSSPVTVSGVANTFEATVLFKVLDADGNEVQVGEAFTTATCGTGCWGDYTFDLAYQVDEEQPGTIVVMESDPSDGEGQPPRSVQIPVTLLP